MGRWIYVGVMKLRIILIISSIGILTTFLILYLHIDSLKYHANDIIKVNDITKNIETDLINAIDLKQVEKRYECSIILKSEEDYSNKLNAAIKKGNVILDYEEGNTLLGKIIMKANSDSFHKLKQNLIITLFITIVAILLFMYLLIAYLYVRIIRPFKKLTYFADNISVGNLEIPLTMEKGNYFGAFTESFDMMREELKIARQAEYEANKSKKELVASLSHDIKTPVATIKALCEILDIKLKEEDTLSKIHTINQKAEIIETLINNMFHAALEELEVLKIEPTEELSTVIIPMFEEINHYQKIHFKNEVPGCLIYCDKLRLHQVIDNVINNSYKYASTDIDVTFTEKDDIIKIEIRDYGKDMRIEDIPLVLNKYYRGKNASSRTGAGLGLYLAKQFMEGMKGDIECYLDNGFVVLIRVRKV